MVGSLFYRKNDVPHNTNIEAKRPAAEFPGYAVRH
jgi:hypothetical protein